MQAVNSTMSEECENCHNLQYQLDETADFIARLTKSELWNIAFYRQQFHQQEQKYEIDLQNIAEGRQKIYEAQAVHLNKKVEIAERSLVHEFKCHRDTEKILRDTKEALAYEQARNTKLFAIVQNALQHTLKELKEGEREGDDNRELNVE